MQSDVNPGPAFRIMILHSLVVFRVKESHECSLDIFGIYYVVIHPDWALPDLAQRR